MPRPDTTNPLVRYVLLPAILLFVGLYVLFMRTQQRQYYAECRQVCAAAGMYHVEQVVMPPFHAPECRCVPWGSAAREQGTSTVTPSPSSEE
ncbi:MAG: hypothetical protein FIB06_01495 [Betaproteobacteria bacterium]|nr:hypothetical protein [Betaproteobacteria bacterium]